MQDSKKNEEKIPFHTRFGLRFLQVLLIVFALLLLKRCVDIYSHNKITDEQIKIEYFEKGYENGWQKALNGTETNEPPFKNYTLKKAYRDGYREGWDSGRQRKRSQQ